MSSSFSVYDIITDQIIKKLESGCIPWRKAYAGGFPQNGISKKDYRGINSIMLLCESRSNPYWLTFKQINEMGGHVKKGEHASKVIFVKPVKNISENEAGELEESRGAIMRYYNVFNFDQTEGLPAEKFSVELKHHEPIPEAEAIIKGYQGAPIVQHKEQRAYYSPGQDYINMPILGSYDEPEFYYKTLFHELTHSTGHTSRLDRGLTGHSASGEEEYSKEELVAEIGASFLSGHCGIFNDPQLEQSAAYINSWIKALKNDKQMLIQAAAKAQKAADFILGRQVIS